MDTSPRMDVAAAVRTLPPSGARRDRALQRLTLAYAAREAAAALRAAASRARAHAGQATSARSASAVADVLAAAAPVWDEMRALDAATGSDDAVRADAREQFERAVLSPTFLPVVPLWVSELREVASTRPGTGACTVATAMQLWTWAVTFFRQESPRREGVISELAEAFCWLVAARAQILELLERKGDASGVSDQFLTDLCHVQAAQSAGAVASLCADVVFGYRKHPAWEVEGCTSCFTAVDLDSLEGLIPGIASAARGHSDVIEADGSHPAKAGPCARFDGVDAFSRLRARLDGCLTGARLARDRAAAALPQIAQ